MPHRLTLDVGTTAVKAGLFDSELKLAAFHIEEYSLITPAPEIVEMRPETYWRAAVKGIRRVVAESGVKPSEIGSITCSTQGETLIAVDSAGRPLHNAIVWLDGRAARQSDRLVRDFPPARLYPVTGVPEMSALVPAAKVLWLRENLPAVFEKTHKLLLLEDYLVLRLSGEYVTNPAVMCSTGYFDIHRDVLWDDMLAACGVDAGLFPRVMPCGAVVGNLGPEAAAELGLPATVKVTTGGMDQAVSAVGSGNIRAGVVSEITGTVLGVTATADDFPGGRVSPVCVYRHAVGGKFLLFSFSQTGGMVLKWFRDEFCADLAAGGRGYDAMTSLAEAVPPLSGGLTVFPHFTGTLIPETNAAARGVFFGVGLNSTRAHFIRAILESVGYMLRENIEAMRRDFGVEAKEIYALGGGAKSPLWLQIKADINRLPLRRLAQDESTSLGAAMLGGVALGDFAGLEEATACVREGGDRYRPRPDVADLYQGGYEAYLRLYPRLKPLFKA